MTNKHKSAAAWSDVKAKLADFDHAALLGLVQDLYAVSKDNRNFLHTRFGLGCDVLNLVYVRQMMRPKISDRLREIAAEIEQRGFANQTRLTVLKKWFEAPSRPSSFAIFVADQASKQKAKTTKEEAELFREARASLADVDVFAPVIPRAAATKLHADLRAFQNEHRHAAWGDVRIIHDHNLFLVECELHIYLGHGATPTEGCQIGISSRPHHPTSEWRADEKPALVEGLSTDRTGPGRPVDHRAQRPRQRHDDVVAHDGGFHAHYRLRRQRSRPQFHGAAGDEGMRDRDPGGGNGGEGRRDRQLLGARRRQVRVLPPDAGEGGVRDGAVDRRMLRQHRMQGRRYAACEQIRPVRIGGS